MADKSKTPQIAAPDTETAHDAEEKSAGRQWYFWPVAGLIAMTAVFVIGLIAALVLALVSDSGDVANAVKIIRDLFIIVLAMEGMFMMIALIVLIIQIAALVNLLQNEIQPIVDNANETVTTVRGTAQFMSQNVVEPVIKFGALTAGIGGVVREVFKLRKSLNNARQNGQPTDE